MIDVNQALAVLTLVLGLFVGVIGFLQWRTAHQRAVLDLFQERFKIWNALRGVIAEVVRNGSVSNTTALEFSRARDGVEFLFGPEIQKYLDFIYQQLLEHNVAESKMEYGNSDQRSAEIEKKYKAFKEISGFFVDFVRLLKPYMRMHQKAPWI